MELFNSKNCQYETTCKGGMLCWNKCPLNRVYESVTKETPKEFQKPYERFLVALAEGRNIFLSAPGGYGKSFLMNQLDKELPNIITMTATTGIAALNINGATIHSTLGLGIGKGSVESMVKKMNSYKLNFLNDLKILAIDEVSMLSSELLDKCNELLKLTRMSNKPFGGVQVILIGDFCQLPPVDEKPNKDYCFYSQTWKELNLANIVLEYNFRQKEDSDYAEMLGLLRQGKLTQKGYDLIRSRLVDEPPIDVPRLYATNNEVYQYNMEKLRELDKPIKTFKAKYSSPNENISRNTEFFNSLVEKLKKASITDDELSLCEGARVMLTRNLDITNGLVNGRLGYIKEFNEDKSILVEFDNGEIYNVKETVTDMHDAEGKVLVSQTQYPLKLAASVTSHKAQGQTMEKVFIDFNKFFEVNQAYVALSRVKSSKGLYVKNFKTSSITFAPEVLTFYSNLQ